jgi:hypothetical protein
MQSPIDSNFEVRPVGREFSGESFGFTNIGIQELLKHKEGATSEEQQKIDARIKEMEEGMPDLISSFDQVRGSLVDSKDFLQAVANHDALGLAAAVNKLKEVDPESPNALYFMAISRDTEKYSDLDALWRYLEKNFGK